MGGGWSALAVGEIDGLEISRAGTQDKLAALLDAEQARALQTVDLGMPSFANLAGRTSTADPRDQDAFGSLAARAQMDHTHGGR